MTLKNAKAVLSVAMCACLLSGCGTSGASASLPSAALSAGADEGKAGVDPAGGAGQASLAETAAPAAGEISSTEDASRWEQQALVLTAQIVDSCLQSFDETVGINELNDREIFNFICTISQYYGESGYPYAGAMAVTQSDLVAHIPEQAAQTIAYQLFSKSDWSYDAPDCYDGMVPEYRFNLEAGGPVSPYSCQDATAAQSEDSVTVSFRLTGSLAFAGATEEPLAEYGSFKAVYRLRSEDGATFLRLESILPL